MENRGRSKIRNSKHMVNLEASQNQKENSSVFIVIKKVTQEESARLGKINRKMRKFRVK